MKLQLRRITFVALSAILLTFTQTVKSQEQVVDFLKGGVDDANLLFESYMEPFGSMLGSSLNGGWYNSAKPHKLGGFDLTLTTSIAMAPASAKEFDLSEIDFNELRLANPSDNMAPTLSGENKQGPLLISNTTGLEFNTPNGADLGFFPAPMINVGIGLPFSMEIKARYIPTVDLMDYGSIGLWGVGLKKSIKDMIPGGAVIPFQFSFFAGYTKFNSSFDIDFGPDAYGNNVNVLTSNAFDDQKMDVEASAFNTQLIVSKSIPVLTVYAGFGYGSVKSNFKLAGDYPLVSVNDDISDPDFGELQITDNDVETDPVNLDYDDLKGLQYTAGLRIKLAVITFHFDYTKFEYPVYSAGVGISFR